jgi:hypothetical protein
MERCEDKVSIEKYWRRGIFGIFVLLFTILMGLSFVSATTYYFDYESGDDSNDGLTTGTAKQNFYKYIYSTPSPAALASGSTIYLMNGTHYVNDTALSSMYFSNSYNFVGESKDGTIITTNDSTFANKYLFYPAGSSNFSNFTLLEDVVSINTGFRFINNAAGRTYRVDNVKIVEFSVAFGATSTSGVQVDTFSNIELVNITNVYGGNGDNLANITFINITSRNQKGGIDFFGTYVLNNYTITNLTFYEDVVINDLLSLEIFKNANYLEKKYLSIQGDMEGNNLSDFHFDNGNLSSGRTTKLSLGVLSNFYLYNLSFGTDSLPLEFDNVSSSMIALGGINNLTIENFSIYHNSTNARQYSAIITNTLTNDNITLKNGMIKIYNNASSSTGIRFRSNHTLIDNVSVYSDSDANYLIGIGSEGMPAGGLWNNCTIRNSYVETSATTSSTIHNIYVGYTGNVTMENLTSINGGYGFIFEGVENSNGTNLFTNNSELMGFYLLATGNSTFIENGTCEATDTCVFIDTDDSIMGSWNSVNLTLTNMSFTCTSESVECALIKNASTYFYDVEIDAPINYSIDEEGFLYNYYSINLSGDNEILFNLTDNQSNNYEDYNSTNYSTLYFLSSHYNSTGNISYSPYNYTASRTGYTSETGSFNLTTPYILNLELSVIPASDEEETTSTGGSSPIISLSDSQFEQGVSKKMYKNYIIKFNLNESLHSLRLDSIEEEYVTFTLSSDPVVFNASEKSIYKFDLDEDGFYDVKIFIEEIGFNFVNLNISKIYEEIDVEESEGFFKEKKETVQGKIILDSNDFFWNYKSLLAFIFIIFVLILFWEDLKKNHFGNSSRNYKKVSKKKK